MTRELKLALIVGFALVLVVTVLISDHLSHARQTKIATLPTEPIRVTEPQQIALDATPEPIAAAPGTPNTIAPMPLTGSGATSELGPIVISQGSGPSNPGSSARPSSLEETVRANGGTIRDGVIHMGGPAMQTGVEPIPGTGSGGTTTLIANKPSVTGPATGPFAIPTTPNRATGSTAAANASNDPTHVVTDGENYFKITRQYYGDGKLWRKLVKYNGLAEASPLKVGQKIRVPAKDVLLGKSVLAGTTPSLSTALSNLPSTQPNDRVVPLRNGVPLTGTALTGSGRTTSLTSAPSTRAGKTHTYTVKKGDTLADIARRELGSSKRGEEIAMLNRKTMKDSDTVPLGAVLTIPN